MKKYLITIALLVLISIVFFCNFDKNINSKPILLSPKSSIKLTVPEPSGLCYDSNSNSLWTVSDEDTTICNIDLSGNVVKKIKVNGYDLEGITMFNDSTLITILERSREVVFINKNGIEQKRFSLKIGGKPNEGLEGIAFNPNNNYLYLIKEKNPCLLIETDLEGKVFSERKLNISKDLSGLYYDIIKDELWIISDESKAIFKCKTDGTIINEFKVDIKQIEGIAIDFTNSLLYLVSDKTEKLYTFDLP
jgi:uncharacterized protein YjiK